MASQVHVYRLIATFGPEQVFRALKIVKEHDNQRDYEPDFEFDWMARKIVLSANSEEGLLECHDHLLHQLEKFGAEKDSMLPGAIQAHEAECRWVRPYGVAVHDAATFGELIGNSLVEIGLRGVQIIDSAEGCQIVVPMNALALSVDYRSFIEEFPLPSYVKLYDEGVRADTRPKKKSKPPKKKKKKR